MFPTAKQLLIIVPLLLLALFGTAVLATAEETPIGKQINDFQLPSNLGASQSLSDWKDKPVVAIVFLNAQCPLCKLYGPRLAELSARYAEQGVQFVGIDSNQQDSLATITQYAKGSKIEFPMLKDPGNAVADKFGALRTPEVFLLDRDRVVRYWGAIDDQYGVGVVRPKVNQEYLAAAIDKLLAAQPIETPVARAVGCFINRVNRKEQTGDITYSNQIARIVNQHCVECHRPGQVAPFTLTSYDDVSNWADTICEVVRQERMPPWRANPQYGKFKNDARLSDDDKNAIYQWTKNGVPQGNSADLPEPPQFDPDWRIPKPDLIVRMPKPFTVPAKGVVPYQYFVVDPGFKEDVWVRCAEGRPGDRSVVHHMILFSLPPGQTGHRGEDALGNAIASFVPGKPATIWPDGYARRIPAGSKLVFQMHYTPNGTEQVDQSEAGLVFADAKTVKKEVLSGTSLNTKFAIPPGDADYPVEASYHFSQDTVLYSLVPHMHFRGKSFRFVAKYPDQSEEVLLDVPRYDFNWQNTYVLAEPKLMPDGTELVCTAHFDNSADNPVNPDPTQTVHWGEQTWEEMDIGSFSAALPEQNLTLGPPQVHQLSSGDYEVMFRYKPPEAAEAVYLAGEFNKWKPDALKMDGPNEDGFYTTTLPLAAGRYEYKFVVNGTRWKPDPGNREQAGNYHNSVVVVGTAEAPAQH
jgi:peroxiredoxin